MSGIQSLIAQLPRNPRFWLILEILAAMAVGFWFGYWDTRLAPDSGDYTAMTQMDWKPALTMIRTLGYPFLLELPAALADNWTLVPAMHWALVAVAALLFDFGLRRFGIAPWTAMVLSTAVLCGMLQQPSLVPEVLTDVPASAFSVMAVGCLFWLAACPKSIFAWVCLATTATATYHIRPMYLFMIPLLPCLTMVMASLMPKRTDWLLRSAALATILAIILTVPFLLYCATRYVVVGHFGLVSFGGLSTSGLATELLDDRMVHDELPSEVRTLATEIYRRRQTMGMKNAFYSGTFVDLYQYDRNFSINEWSIALPAATEIYGENQRLVNDKLGEFARAVISRRKALVLLWAAETYPRSVLKLLAKSWVMILLVPLVLLMHVVRRYLSSAPAGGRLPDVERNLLVMFSLLATMFFFADLTVIVLSGVYAESRFVITGAVLVPCPLALLLFYDLKAVCSARMGGSRLVPEHHDE
jgi:hypothetical protein